MSKRKRDDRLLVNFAEDLQVKLRSAITSYDSAEVAVLYLIHQYKFDPVRVLL
jgi:hypothetical protein